MFKVSDETESLWRLLAPGTHARIASVLDADASVQADIRAKLAHPGDSAARAALFVLITRLTGNCVGQAILQEVQGKHAGDLSLTPGSDKESLFKALQTGTEADIATAIGGAAATHLALASGDHATIVRSISRMTGNCLGQAIVAQGASLPMLIGKLRGLSGLPVI